MTTSNLHLTYRDGGTAPGEDPYTGLDRFGRLVETLWKKESTDKVRSKYGRNRLGGVTWRRDEEAHAQGVGTEDNLYGYDALQQVKARQRGDLTGTALDYTGITNLQQQEGWTYDATGNWAACSDTSPANAQTRIHNTDNEITQIASAPGSIAPAYDPAGNMLTLPKQPGLSAEQYDLTWDAWNRLVAVKDGETPVANYTYDGLTRRLTKTNAAETRHYYYNAAWRALEERVEDASTAVDRQYTWGLRDRWDLLRRKRSVSASLDETLYVLRDYLDPVAIVDQSGQVLERYAYDAFGNVRYLAPDFTARTVSDFDWNFIFHAEFLDSDTGLYNYGYRYYSPGLGRWLGRDPIGEEGGLNLYNFVLNNPVAEADLEGLQSRQIDPRDIPFPRPRPGPPSNPRPTPKPLPHPTPSPRTGAISGEISFYLKDYVNYAADGVIRLGVELTATGDLRIEYDDIVRQAKLLGLPEKEARELRNLIKTEYRKDVPRLFHEFTKQIDANRAKAGHVPRQNNPYKTNPGITSQGRVFAVLGRTMLVVGYAIEIKNIATADDPAAEIPRAAGRLGGAAAGAWAFGGIGAGIGGPWGMVGGIVVGGIAGSIGGEGWVDWFCEK